MSRKSAKKLMTGKLEWPRMPKSTKPIGTLMMIVIIPHRDSNGALV